MTDDKGKVVDYSYDSTGNQTKVSYPDGTAVTNTYDKLGQLKTVTEADGRATTYTYDGMGRTVKMEYPHGWVEDYVYDSIGQLLRVDDTDPTSKDMKQQKHVYKYDDCGNMVYEYMRGNGTGEATTENTYTYDALHRITGAKENYGNASRAYTYDSLGNLTYESNSNNVQYDYKLNNLNQLVEKTYSDCKEHTVYTYDGRGNLVLEEYGKNKKLETVGKYTYDETNKMVQGVNASGESSSYLYNGLGALVENTWVIAKNSYGYHDVDATAEAAQPDVEQPGIMPLSNGNGGGKGNGQGNGNGKGDKPTGSDVKKTSTVVKQFVVDYTSATFEPLSEHEVNGLDYRYVYGNDRLSVNITGVETSSGNLIENGNQIRLYYHMDLLGTTDYLTSPVSQKVTSWTHYNEWGEITHNAVLKSGKRELDLVKRYATHDYDAVLNMYYAKARMYDAENRRFAAMDPVKGRIVEPMTMVQYLYVVDNPLRYIDPLGLTYFLYMKDLNGYVLAKKELEFTKFVRNKIVHVREVADLISKASGYDAKVNYIKDSNSVNFDITSGTTNYKMSAFINLMDIDWSLGLGNWVSSNDVYFNLYDCLGDDKVVVDLDSLGTKLGVRFEIAWEADGWRPVGVGIQGEMSVKVSPGFYAVVGFEAVWYVDMNLEGNDNLFLPDVYIYNGTSVGIAPGQIAEDVLNYLGVIFDKSSSNLAVFAIAGNEKFTSVDSYNGGFRSYSGSIAGKKVYYSWSDSCKVVGYAKDDNAFSFSYSETDYMRVLGENGVSNEFKDNVYNAIDVALGLLFPN